MTIRSSLMTSLLSFGLFFSNQASSSQDDPSLLQHENIRKWCASNYPKDPHCLEIENDIIKASKEVMMKEYTDLMNWCIKINHRNVSCPMYSEKMAENKALDAKILGDQRVHSDDPRFLEWCDSIYHQHPDCPGMGIVKVPQEVKEKKYTALMKWCNKINHTNVSCPKYSEKMAEIKALEAKMLRDGCFEHNFPPKACQTLLDPNQLSAQADRALSGNKGVGDQRVHSQATQKIWGFEHGSWGYSILEKLGVGTPSAGSAR